MGPRILTLPFAPKVQLESSTRDSHVHGIEVSCGLANHQIDLLYQWLAVWPVGRPRMVMVTNTDRVWRVSILESINKAKCSMLVDIWQNAGGPVGWLGRE